jgi:putative transposase
MGMERLSKDQVSAMCEHPDSEAEELAARPLGPSRTPYPWVDATYVKCRRDRRVASAAVVTAIGCDEDGWRRVLGIGIVDTESYDSWSEFLGRVKARDITGVRLATSDAHEGLRRAMEEVFQGAAWQRCVVHLKRDRARAASGSRSPRRRISGIVAPVFRLRDAGAAGAACHLAIETLESCRGDAARILGEAEPDALACLDLPASHWKRPRANNVRERANGETRRRSHVAQVFPSVASLERLAGAAMCDMDEEWQDARYFSRQRMDELHDESGAAGAEEPPTPEGLAEWRLVAKRAIDASLELADEMGAA